MTTAPYVELGFNPTELRPQDLPRAGAFLGSPAEALEAAFAVVRAQMVDQMREELRGLAQPTHAQLLRIADLAWQAAFWRYRKISAPIIADAYVSAYRRADAGDVPMSMIYDLADKHVEKIGGYFHDSSRDALAEGFSTLVNRRVPAKAAADRVLDGYGLTPRQMRAYTSAKQFETPISNVLPRPLKAKVRAYVDKAFTSRIRKFSAQEEHNIDEQAKQLAWMWLQDKGRLNAKAQKIWITARDERVCPVCGPLHGKKVGVNQQFKTSQGEFWTPGLHPNCRCMVRLLEHRFTKSAFGIVEKDLSGSGLAEFNRLHPRADGGRFGTKARTRPTKTIDVDEEFKQIVATPVRAPVRHITYTEPAVAEPDTQTDTQFAQLIAAQPKRRGLTSVWDSPLAVQTFKTEALTNIAAPEPMIDFAADLAVDLRARTRLQLQTKPKLALTKTPTIPVNPAYAVITYENLEDGDITQGIRLNHGITFTTDEIGAAQEAGEEIQRRTEVAVEDMLDQLEKDSGRTVRKQDPETGEWRYAYISPQTVEGIASWYARNATEEWHQDYDSNFDETVLLDWVDEEGEDINFRNERDRFVVQERMSYRQLGHNYFEQHIPDYQVYVVGIDQVPTTEGAVEDISGGANTKQREFSVDGDYSFVPNSQRRTQEHNYYGATIYNIEPRHSVELPDENE